MTVTPADFDVCPWELDTSCEAEEWASYPPEVQLRAQMLASSTLHRLTGYRVGGCPVTVRPCKVTCAEECGRFGYGGVFNPHVDITGQWVNSCGCRNDCSCGPLCEVRLPPPVGEVILVDVGGMDYTLETKIQGDRLVYTGTEDCPFPSCQDLAAAPGSPNTFTVTYLNSYPVDALGSAAAGRLAVEYARACGGGRCSLPPGVTQVARQGITIQVEGGAFPNGFTGIREVDAYIALYRPEGSPRWAPRIWSPQTQPVRVER